MYQSLKQGSGEWSGEVVKRSFNVIRNRLSAIEPVRLNFVCVHNKVIFVSSFRVILWIEGNHWHHRFDTISWHVMSCHEVPDHFLFWCLEVLWIAFCDWLMGYHTSVWNLYHHFYFLLRNVTFTDSRRRLTFFWERLLINFCVIYTSNLFFFEIIFFPRSFFVDLGPLVPLDSIRLNFSWKFNKDHSKEKPNIESFLRRHWNFPNIQVRESTFSSGCESTRWSCDMNQISKGTNCSVVLY